MCRSPYFFLLIVLKLAQGNDWASWRGPTGDGIWPTEDIEPFPEQGLEPSWRASIGPGYSGVAVAEGRVYTMDLEEKEGQKRERLVCFDTESGKQLWWSAYDVNYGDLSYAKGPRSMPTVHKGRVYTLGAVGHLACHDAKTGKQIWFVDSTRDWMAKRPTWGYSAALRLWEGKLYAPLGLENGGALAAIDPQTGQKLWQSGGDGAGYGWPVPIKTGGETQFLYWSPNKVLGLDPTNGDILWSHPYKVKYGVSIATPIFHQGIAYVAGYWHGSRALKLGANNNPPKLLWETEDTLCGLMAQPLYRGGTAYLMDRRTGVNAFDFKTGKILWTANNHYEPKDRNPQATLVWVGNTEKVLLLNSLGELILAEFRPDGHRELSRVQIVGKTWAHPAYAGDSIFARSDRELVRVRLPVHMTQKN